MNSGESTTNDIKYYYIVCSLSAIFALTAVIISIVIITLIWRTKPLLHTVRHLLMCNTCIASVLYCIIQTNNYTFLLFLQDQTSDIGCRWRGYFSYFTICSIAYSFLIQAISRLFISIFPRKYRWLTTLKGHYILVSVQWLISICLPLPSLITEDIYFRPNTLCWVPSKKIVHGNYTYVVYYIIPVVSVCVIYIYIYYQVRKITNRTEILCNLTIKGKRTLELLRNIVILLMIYVIGGSPTVLFLLTSNKILYWIGLVSISLTVAIEKVSTIVLDRELRQVIKKLLKTKKRIVPIENTNITRRQENVIQIQRTAV